MLDVDWKPFFGQYAIATRNGDASAVAQFYGEGFLVAGPTGAAAFENDDSHEDQESVMRQKGLL